MINQPYVSNPTLKSHFAYLLFLLHVISKSIVNVVYRLAKRDPCSWGISGKIPADFPTARISTEEFWYDLVTDLQI